MQNSDSKKIVNRLTIPLVSEHLRILENSLQRSEQNILNQKAGPFSTLQFQTNVS